MTLRLRRNALARPLREDDETEWAETEKRVWAIVSAACGESRVSLAGTEELRDKVCVSFTGCGWIDCNELVAALEPGMRAYIMDSPDLDQPYRMEVHMDKDALFAKRKCLPPAMRRKLSIILAVIVALALVAALAYILHGMRVL